MKKLYLIANWKMNPTTEKQAQKLASDIASGLKKQKLSKNTEVVLCPPFPYLPAVGKNLNNIKLGAQNCHFEEKGAYTGETSPKMLKDLGCKFVIVGHSERRKYFGEKGELISKKVKAVLKARLIPVLAVGEREGESLSIVSKQLKEAFNGITEAEAKKMVIAYEPVWAIGTGKAASPNEAMSARILIQKNLKEIYSEKIANSMHITYGGSTDSKNILSFIQESEMDGALVGGSSLKAKEFIKMAQKIDNA